MRKEFDEVNADILDEAIQKKIYEKIEKENPLATKKYKKDLFTIYNNDSKIRYHYYKEIMEQYEQ